MTWDDMVRLSARRAPLTLTMQSPLTREMTLTSAPSTKPRLREVLAQLRAAADLGDAGDLVLAHHAERKLAAHVGGSLSGCGLRAKSLQGRCLRCHCCLLFCRLAAI